MDDLLTKGKDYYQFKEFLKYGVIAAFSKRNLDLGFRAASLEQIKHRRKAFLDNFSINYEDLVCCQQTHGGNVALVSRHDAGRGAYDFETAVMDTDALVTNCRNLALAVFSADCLSIFLYAQDKNVIAIVHAGWQGTKENITKNTVELILNRFNIDVAGLLVGFGPAIRSCCYEVREEFKDYFSFGLIERQNRLYLDLIELNLAQLKDLGVRKEQILDAGFCTSCMNTEFFSYRREGVQAGRMMSVIMLKGKTAFLKSYAVGFSLNSWFATEDLVRNSLLEFGSNLQVKETIPQTSEKQKTFQVHIITQDPTIIFDICAQFGRIKAVKVEEIE